MQWLEAAIWAFCIGFTYLLVGAGMFVLFGFACAGFVRMCKTMIRWAERI